MRESRYPWTRSLSVPDRSKPRRWTAYATIEREVEDAGGQAPSAEDFPVSVGAQELAKLRERARKRHELYAASVAALPDSLAEGYQDYARGNRRLPQRWTDALWYQRGQRLAEHHALGTRRRAADPRRESRLAAGERAWRRGASLKSLSNPLEREGWKQARLDYLESMLPGRHS